MDPNHHPTEVTLLAYAAGNLGKAASRVVAHHVAFCPSCRSVVAVGEMVGGALLEALTPDLLSPDAKRNTLLALQRGDVAGFAKESRRNRGVGYRSAVQRCAKALSCYRPPSLPTLVSGPRGTAGSSTVGLTWGRCEGQQLTTEHCAEAGHQGHSLRLGRAGTQRMTTSVTAPVSAPAPAASRLSAFAHIIETLAR